MAAGHFVFLAALVGSTGGYAGEDVKQESMNPTPTPTSTLSEILVTGIKLSDTEERRYSTAAKMVFGREELDRYGDSSVGE